MNDDDGRSGRNILLSEDSRTPWNNKSFWSAPRVSDLPLQIRSDGAAILNGFRRTHWCSFATSRRWQSFAWDRNSRPPPFVGARRQARDPNGQSITRSRCLKVLKTVVKVLKVWISATKSRSGVSTLSPKWSAQLNLPNYCNLDFMWRVSFKSAANCLFHFNWFGSCWSGPRAISPTKFAFVHQTIFATIKLFFIGHVFGSILQRVTFTWASKLVSSRCKLWSISQ